MLIYGEPSGISTLSAEPREARPHRHPVYQHYTLFAEIFAREMFPLTISFFKAKPIEEPPKSWLKACKLMLKRFGTRAPANAVVGQHALLHLLVT